MLGAFGLAACNALLGADGHELAVDAAVEGGGGAPDVGADVAADAPATCIIDGTTYPSHTANPANACQSCQPATSTTQWSNACPLTGETCNGGTCACLTGQTGCTTACVDEQTDADNCGACGRLLPGRRLRRRGVPAPLLARAVGQESPMLLAVDSTNVFWTDWGDTVMSVPLSPGTTT